MRKAYIRPHEEHAGFFVMFALRNLLVIAALENHSLTTVLFPNAACLLLIAVILAGRRPRSAGSGTSAREAPGPSSGAR